MPRGKLLSQNNLKTTAHGSSYELDFVSPILADVDPRQPKGERLHLGHWRFAGGPPSDFQYALAGRLTDGKKITLNPIAEFSVGEVQAAVYRREANLYNIDQGHVFALWNFDGNTYELSVHGIEHRQTMIAMAEALIEEMTGCAPGEGSQAEGVCGLAFPGGDDLPVPVEPRLSSQASSLNSGLASLLRPSTARPYGDDGPCGRACSRSPSAA